LELFYMKPSWKLPMGVLFLQKRAHHLELAQKSEKFWR